MKEDLLTQPEGSLSDIINSYHSQEFEGLVDNKPIASFTYFMRNHFYHKQWLISWSCLGNAEGLAYAKALAVLARLGVDEIPTVHQLSTENKPAASKASFLEHLYGVFKKQQITHHAYLNREDRAQIDRVQNALASKLKSESDAGKLNQHINDYYYKILHQEDYKHNPDYSLIAEKTFKDDIEAVCNIPYQTILYDLRVLAKNSREQARALEDERAVVRASIDNVALTCNLPLQIVPVDRLTSEKKVFSIEEKQGYQERKSHAAFPKYHFPSYRVIYKEKKGIKTQCVSPIKGAGDFREEVRKEYRNTYYTAVFAAIAALLIGIGEGGVAADEIYKKLEDQNKVLAVVALGCVFVGGSITNYFLTCDDTKWCSDQWLNKKIFKDRFGQPVSWRTSLMIVAGILAALSAGASLGALEWADNAELVGQWVAIPSAAMATLGFFAIFQVVLTEFIKENIFKLIGMYLADSARYISMLWSSHNVCSAFVKITAFIVFEIVKVAVGQSLNLTYALANYYVFSAITEFFSAPIPPELASFVAIVFVSTDALWGGRKVQIQINDFFDAAYAKLFGDKTHTKSQGFTFAPVDEREQNALEKCVNKQFAWKKIIAYGSLLLNTAGMVALNAQEETLDVLSSTLGVDNRYFLYGLIIAATSFRSGLPSLSAMKLSFSSGHLTPFYRCNTDPERDKTLDVEQGFGGENDVSLNWRRIGPA